MKNCTQLEKFTVWNIRYIRSSRYRTTVFTLVEFKSHINLPMSVLGIFHLVENTVWTHSDVYRHLRNFDNEKETILEVFEMWFYRKIV